MYMNLISSCNSAFLQQYLTSQNNSTSYRYHTHQHSAGQSSDVTTAYTLHCALASYRNDMRWCLGRPVTIVSTYNLRSVISDNFCRMTLSYNPYVHLWYALVWKTILFLYRFNCE